MLDQEFLDVSIPNNGREFCGCCLKECSSLRRANCGFSSSLARICVSCFEGSAAKGGSSPTLFASCGIVASNNARVFIVRHLVPHRPLSKSWRNALPVAVCKLEFSVSTTRVLMQERGSGGYRCTIRSELWEPITCPVIFLSEAEVR